MDRDLRRVATLVGLLCSLFLAALDFSIITTALPSISSDLRSQTAYVWIGSSYLLTSAAFMPVWGKAADIWGRNRALLSSIALLSIGSAICGWSKTVAQLISGRAVQGCAAGGIIVLVNISISDLWDTRHRSMFLATTGLVWAISAGVGPLLGGLLSGTWRWIFWLNLPSSLATFVVLFFSMPSAPSRAGNSEHNKGMDWLGSLAIVGVTIMILLSLDFGGVVSPWGSAKVLGLLIGGFVLLVFFVFWEARGAPNPLVPGRLINHLSKISPLIVCFMHGFVNVSSWYFLPLYFQAVRGASPTSSGILIMPIVVIQAVIGVVAGAITFRFGLIRPLIWLGMGFSTLGFSLFTSIGPSTPLVNTIVIEIVAALGVGATFQAPLIAYQSLVESSDIAVATALFGFVRNFSTSVSVVMGGVIFQNQMSNQRKHLSMVLGPELAQNFSGSAAATNVLALYTLPMHQQVEVRKAYASSLQDMWIMYASTAAIGLVAAFFVKQKTLGDTNGSAPERNGVELVQDPN